MKKLRGVGNVALQRFQLLQLLQLQIAALWCCPGCQWVMLWMLTRLPNFRASWYKKMHRTSDCFTASQLSRSAHLPARQKSSRLESIPRSRGLSDPGRWHSPQKKKKRWLGSGAISKAISKQNQAGLDPIVNTSDAEPCHHLGSSTVRYIKSFCGLCIASRWKATHDDKRQHKATNPQVAASVNLGKMWKSN